MEPVAVVTTLILLQYALFGFLVGRARGRSGVKAPAVSGDPVFERCFRAHQNSLEQMAVTVPALWLFAMYVNAQAAALLGIVYLVGRGVYFRAYVADPAGRGPGFLIGLLATMILSCGALVGTALHWLR